MAYKRRLGVMVAAWLALLLPTAATPADDAADATVALTQSGPVHGISRDGVTAFRGIPYAAAPTGALRWQPPQPPPTWTAPRAATEFGPACPQPPRGGGGQRADGLGAAPARQSEDCLSINVWTPDTRGQAPVMVWMHGGAHRFGASSLPFYDGEALARQGVVLVSFNYRLGLFGYFAHPALTTSVAAEQPLGNYGLLDQLAALRWVQQNIARFGGDPARVTVFGESAGGASILYLLATPAAKGLFAQAIVESGGGWQKTVTLAEKEQEGIAAARKAGLPEQATLEQLRALPVEALNDAVSVAPVLSFGPFVDGRTVVESPAAAFAQGRALDLPLIIGSNSNEASLLDAVNLPPAAMLNRLPPAALQAARSAYAGLAEDDEALARALFADGSFTAPARWVAAQAQDGAPSWLYRFAYTLALRGESEGANHAAEIPYVFKSWGAIPALQSFVGDRDRAMAGTISACWVAFASTGKPACAGAPAWPAYRAQADTLLEFGAPTQLRTQFRKPALDYHEARFTEGKKGEPR